jgi:hypothetical protein
LKPNGQTTKETKEVSAKSYVSVVVKKNVQTIKFFNDLYALY